jgi:hypothetical protein
MIACAVGLALVYRRGHRLEADALRAMLAVLGWIVLVRRAPQLLDENGPWAAVGLLETVAVAVVFLPPVIIRALAYPGSFRPARPG